MTSPRDSRLPVTAIVSRILFLAFQTFRPPKSGREAAYSPLPWTGFRISSLVPPQALLEGNILFTDYKGAITEQYVLQQLKSVKGLNIYYWSSDTSKGELDFLLQKEIYIIPVEVKAEENLQSKSLRSFVEKNPGLHGIRFSMSDYRQQEWLTNYPLYSVGYIF